MADPQKSAAPVEALTAAAKGSTRFRLPAIARPGRQNIDRVVDTPRTADRDAFCAHRGPGATADAIAASAGV